MTTKRLIAAMTSILLALILVSPVFSSGAEEEAAADGTSYMRLAWWGNPTRDAKTEQAVDLYTQQNPNVEIELETVGWGGYWDRINTQAAAGNLPDIMQHDYSQIYNWVGRNLLMDLTPYIESGAIDTKNIPDSFLMGGTFNDKVYGISLGTNALSVVIDSVALSNAGIAMPNTATWTWDDFERIALEVYTKTGVQTMPIYHGDPRHGFENMLLQTGQTLFSKDGTSLGFTNTSALKKFFEIQLRLLDAGALVNPDVAFVTVTPEEGVLAKKGTWIDWIWSNQLASTQAVTDNRLEMGLMPKMPSPKRPGTYLKPSMFFSITSQAQNPEEAVKFLNFFINDVKVNQTILQAERGVPIPSNVRETLLGDVDDVNKRIFQFIDLAGQNAGPIPLPDPAKASEVVDIIRNTTIEVLMKRISVDEGVERIVTQGNQVLK